jgi:hypothetical protein
MRILFFQGVLNRRAAFFLLRTASRSPFPGKKAKPGTKKVFPLAKRALTRYIM